MNPSRASIFEMDEIDVSGFAPKSAADAAAPTPDQVRAVAEAANFPSRQPPPLATAYVPEKRQPRRHRTGRTAQLNARTTPQTVATVYAIADAHGWLVGETIERALSALQRELNNKSQESS
ncbi:MAG: stability/partitioning determinant [Bryobacterales bacterium]|nr:stability/partitioning determinant [Bryobacterales bacterium]